MRDRSVGPMAQWYLEHLDVPNYLFALLISSFPALVGLILARSLVSNRTAIADPGDGAFRTFW